MVVYAKIIYVTKAILLRSLRSGVLGVLLFCFSGAVAHAAEPASDDLFNFEHITVLQESETREDYPLINMFGGDEGSGPVPYAILKMGLLKDM